MEWRSEIGKILILRVPPPHPVQRKIEACTAKRIVVKAGRRGGKTTMAARKSLLEATAGHKVLYGSPVFSQTESFWDLVVAWTSDAVKVGLVVKNETKRTLTFIRSGGRIVAKTGSRPDHLRGTWADFLILDEYAYQRPAVWERVGAPMLADNDGTAWFLSTGKKRNHFFLLGLQAQENEDGRWSYFRFPSTANPFLSKLALAELAKDMTDEDYREEILAEDVEGAGAVFRLIREDFSQPDTPLAGLAKVFAAHKGHRCTLGGDWGRLHDWTVTSVGCSQCSVELFLGRWKEETYPVQRDIIAGIYEQGKKADIQLEMLFEENSMGLPQVEQMRADGLPVMSLMVNNADKGQLVQGLRLAFEKRSWQWVFSDWSWRELEGFEQKVTILGNATYDAAEGLHDDSVTARILMLRQAQTGGFTLR